jgi:hypothetical protein
LIQPHASGSLAIFQREEGNLKIAHPTTNAESQSREKYAARGGSACATVDADLTRRGYRPEGK